MDARSSLARAAGFVALAGALPLVVGFGLCGGGGSPPPAARGCDDPADGATISALELGDAGSTPFVPGDRATPMVGGQGLDMLGYRVAVRSSAPVSCIATSARNYEVQPSGEWYVTDPIWEIVPGPDTISVSVEAYGRRVDRTMSATGSALDAGAGGATDGGAGT